jgi:putative DNA-invertase from lambdoid prophage Rac
MTLSVTTLEIIMATIFYARVSTAEQTIEHQLTQAQAAGYAFDHVVTDDGVSGVTTLLKDRVGGRRLFDLLRAGAGDILVVRWIDRLGRNYEDVSDNLREFMKRGVIVKTIINGMDFDGTTTDPIIKGGRDAMIAFMSSFAQAQADATKDAQKSGIAYAKEHKQGSYLGRKPTYTESQIAEVMRLDGEGVSVVEISKQLGLTRQTVYRIKSNSSEAYASVHAWN